MFGATDIVCVGCVVARVGNAEILGAPTNVCPQGLEMKFFKCFPEISHPQEQSFNQRFL